MKNLSMLLLAIALSFTARSTAQPLGDVAYEQALNDLGNGFRMMCVAAHPDDEDGATLAYYRKLHGVKTYAVIATRGEGGQNEIGPELYNELGVIRTREMKAAAEIEGAELHFLNLPEFGYSKTPEETFAVWGKDVAMERMVRMIRTIRPHVIITNHGREKDHGHHQAIGAVVLEAFDAAADASQFPEHGKEGLSPWQVSRLYIRDFRGGEGATATDITALDPVRGKTIAEIAASALEEHKSQGMAYFIDLLLSTRQRMYYNLVKNTPEGRKKGVTVTAAEAGPLFAGLERPPGVPGIAGHAAEGKVAVKNALYTWLRDNTALREGTPDERQRWADANRAAAIVSELRLSARANDSTVCPGQPLKIDVKLIDFGAADAIVATVTLEVNEGLGEIGSHRIEIPLHATHEGEGSFSITIPNTAEATLPLAPHLFDPDFLEPQLAVRASVNCGDAELELAAPVYIDVAAPVSITFPDAPYLARAGNGGNLPVNMLVTNNTAGPYSEYVSLSPPEGWRAEPERMPVSFSKEGEQRIVAFTLTPPAGLTPGDFTARARVVGGGRREEPVLVRAVDIQIPEGRRVGVIQSYDTTFVNTLEKLGVPHESLALKDYQPERLDAFDTIIVDIRAYQYRPDLAANNPTLLDYVQRGGTLLVMYQKTFDWNPDYAPYPITLSRNRVTREDAPVTVLVPENSLFTTPNAIGESDWAGWIQERGLYFPDSWNGHYVPLIQVSDPGEDIPPGSLLFARYGEGAYVYTALGWYRQLRELHPGALRCFANMLAL